MLGRVNFDRPDRFVLVSKTDSLSDMLEICNSGRLPYLMQNAIPYYCVNYTSTMVTFANMYSTVLHLAYKSSTAFSTNSYSLENSDNRLTELDSGCTDSEYPSAKCVYDLIAATEKTENLVTALDSSSSDTQYPSAKCVYDLIGNVETALEALR